MNRYLIAKIGLTLAIPVLLASACTMVPDYKRPDMPVSSTWNSSSTNPDAKKATELAWRDFFLSDEIRNLVTKGLENNRDLRQAALNVQAARAQYRIQRSYLLPSVSGNGTWTRQHTPETTSITGQAQTLSVYDVNVGIASYEIDLFGRLRSLKEAALEDYFATAEARNATQIALVAEISNAYLTLLADRQQLKLSEQTLESQQNSYNLAKSRFDAGVGTKLELRQVETLLETARVDQLANARLIAQDKNALELLVGTPIADSEIAGEFADADKFVSDINEGLPSDLLQNRPDIRQAEHVLKSANANIGAARAAFFPNITLTAATGTAGRELSQLFDGGSGAWSFMPQVTLPIFTAGRNKASLDVANLRKEISIAEYERVIQSAFRDVSNALIARGTLVDQLAAQQKLVVATDDAYKIADARYKRGIDDYLTVLDARRELYAAQQREIATRLAMLSNYVTLYAALGGGQERPPADQE